MNRAELVPTPAYCEYADIEKDYGRGDTMIIRNVLDMIGNTPIVDLSAATGCNIYAKAEFLNLGGSIKDRVAKNMIEAAEK